MRVRDRPLLRFAATVMALLPACFVAWYFVGAIVAAPAVMLAKVLLLNWLPSLVASVSLEGTNMLVLSNYGENAGELLSAADAGNQLGYPINTRTLSYSIPFFTALHFATPGRSSIDRFAWCLLGLWLLLALGLVATAAKELMLSLGEVFISTPGTPPTDAVALIYQFSTLMVPVLAPVLLWAYSAKDSPAFLSLLPPTLQAAPGADNGA